MRERRANAHVLVCGMVLALCAPVAGCSSPTSPDAGFDLGDSVALDGGSALVFENAASLAAHRAKIEQVVADTVVAVNRLMPVNGITIIVRVGTSTVIPELGIGGAAVRRIGRVPFHHRVPARFEASLQGL